MMTAKRWANLLLAALPFAIGALIVWATIPYGGVARWAWASIVGGAFGLSAIAWLVASFLPRSKKLPFWEQVTWAICVLLLFGWALFQLKPLPISTLTSWHAGAAELYTKLFGSGPDAATSLSVDPLQTQLTLISWLAYAVLIWCVARLFLRDRTRIERMCIIIAFTGTIQAVLGMVTHQGQGLLENVFRSARFNGTFSGPNTFAGFLAISIPVTLSLLVVKMTEILAAFKGKIFMALNDKNHGRPMALLVIWSFLGVTVQMVSVILSASRGGTLAMGVCSFAFIGWFALNVRKLRAGKALLGLAAFLSVGVTIAMSSGYLLLWERLQSLADDDLSMGGRLRIWQASLDMFKDHPFGVGAGSYREAIPRYQVEGFGDKRFDLAHNDYIQLLCELGWVGMIPVVLLVALFFRRALGVFRMSIGDPVTWLGRGLFLGLMAGLLHAIVDFNLSSRPGVTILFCVVAGLLLATCAPKEDRSSRSRSSSKPDSDPAAPDSESSKEVAEEHATASEGQSSSSGRRRRRKSKRSSRRGDEGIMLGKFTLGSGIVFVGILVAGVLGTWYMQRAGAARDKIAEGWFGITAQVMGTQMGDRYKYQWKRIPLAEEPVQSLREAVNIMPSDSIAHNLVGRAMVMQSDKELTDAVREAIGRVPESLRESVFDAVYNIQLAYLKPTYVEAVEYMEDSVKMGPWRPDTHAWYGRYLCETVLHDEEAMTARSIGARLPDTAQDRLEQGIHHMGLALELGPNDTASLISVVYGWTAAYLALDEDSAEETKETIQKIGRRVLALGSSARKEIILIWHGAGITLEEMMAIEDLPLASIRDLYSEYEKLGDFENCMKCLDLLEQSIGKQEVDTGLVKRKADQEEFYRDTLQQFVISRRATWQLRRGDWDTYAASSEVREAYWFDALARKIDAKERSKDNLNIKLSGLDKDIGLPPRESLQLAQIEWQEGGKGVVDRRLFQVALRDQIDPRLISDHSWWTAEDLKDPDALPGFSVAEARSLYENGDYQAARNALLPFFAERESSIRVSYKHRLYWLNALCLQKTGFTEEAKEQIRKSLRGSLEDPTTLTTGIMLGMGDETIRNELGRPTTLAELHKKLTPELPINMNFLGEGISLLGFDFETTSRTGKKQLTSYWRFWKRVPSDLEVHVRAIADGNRERYRQISRFKAAAELQFGGGDPKFGSVIKVVTDFPSFLDERDQLSIFLYQRNARKLIPSDDGQRTFVADEWLDKAKPFVAKPE